VALFLPTTALVGPKDVSKLSVKSFLSLRSAPPSRLQSDSVLRMWLSFQESLVLYFIRILACTVGEFLNFRYPIGNLKRLSFSLLPRGNPGDPPLAAYLEAGTVTTLLWIRSPFFPGCRVFSISRPSLGGFWLVFGRERAYRDRVEMRGLGPPQRPLCRQPFFLAGPPPPPYC